LIAGGSALLALGLAAAPFPPEAVERLYTNRVYARLQPGLTGATNLLPIAWLDVLILLSAAALLVVWGRALAPRRRQRRWGRLGGALASTITLLSLAYVLFLLVWGLNYRRPPASAGLDFDPGRVSERAVERLAERAVAELNRLHPIAHASPWPADRQLPAHMAPWLEAAQQAMGQPWTAVPGAPKPTLLGPYFRAAAIAGMLNPFGLEVLITPDALPFERPAILAHEWGHLAGYAREADAAFFGWLLCMQGDAQAQYSGWLDLLPRALGALPPPARDHVRAGLAAGPREDYAAIRLRLQRVSPRVLRLAWGSYDRFLKVNRVAEGVASYDRVVVLVAGTRFEEGWRPARRPS
jgi:hypothetical protein